MSWIILAILAYFLNALVTVFDKILVSKKIPHPWVYAFYVGILSVTVLIFSPFGFFIPPVNILIIALMSGVVFLFGLAVLFSALKEGEASKVAATVGGLTPFFVLLLAYLFLGERLAWQQCLAAFFLIAGGVLINLNRSGRHFGASGLKKASLAAMLLAVSFSLTKFVFLNQPFFNGFIWTRLGSFLLALLFLVPSSLRRKILKINRETKEGVSLAFIGNKALAGLSFLLLNAAFFSGSVTLVNALRGVEYAFVFTIALIFSFKLPQLLQESKSFYLFWQKILGIGLIAVGLVFLWIH